MKAEHRTIHDLLPLNPFFYPCKITSETCYERTVTFQAFVCFCFVLFARVFYYYFTCLGRKKGPLDLPSAELALLCSRRAGIAAHDDSLHEHKNDDGIPRGVRYMHGFGISCQWSRGGGGARDRSIEFQRPEQHCAPGDGRWVKENGVLLYVPLQ